MVLVVAHDSLLQVYLGVVVCILSLVLVARHRPYNKPFYGKLQLLFLTQLTFTYLSGMLFFDQGDGTELWLGDATEGWMDEDGWSAVLIVVNLLAFVVLAVGVSGAFRGAVSDAKAELGRRRAEEERMTGQPTEMRIALDSPSPPLSQARIGPTELEC